MNDNNITTEDLLIKELLEQRQLSYEKEMLETAAASFKKQQEALGSTEGSGTAAGLQFLKASVAPLSDYLSEESSKVRRGKPGILARVHEALTRVRTKAGAVDFDRIAYAVSLVIVDSTFGERSSKTTLCRNIGLAVEDEIRYTELEAFKPGTFKSLGEVAKKRLTSLSVRRVGTVKASNKQGFIEVPQGLKTEIGAVLLEAFIELTGLVDVHIKATKNNKTLYTVELSEEAKAYAEEYLKALSDTKANLRPMIVPPLDWTDNADGGYLSIEKPLIKTRDGSVCTDVDVSTQIAAVNHVQRQGWKINKKMLEIMTTLRNLREDITAESGDVLLHTSTLNEYVYRNDTILDDTSLEGTPQFLKALTEYKDAVVENKVANIRKTSAYISQTQAFSIAKEYSNYAVIYFPHNLDYRGRFYPLPTGLQPQGSDVVRCLLDFSTGKPLGSDGVYSMKIALAGLWGEDTSTMSDRVKWVDDNEDLFRTCTEDPIGTLEIWKESDKPFQCMQLMLAYVEYLETGESYSCSVPIQVDGKCNGLQHFSLLTRDPQTASLVGITEDQGVPGDVYQAIADDASDYIKALSVTPLVVAYEQDNKGREVLTKESKDSICIHYWADKGVTRKLAKSPTMTYVYGSGVYGYGTQVLDKMGTSGKGELVSKAKLAFFLATTLNRSLKRVLAGPAEAMAFIQGCVGVYVDFVEDETSGATCKDLVYTSPSGLRVKKGYYNSKGVKVKAKMFSKHIFVRSYKDTETLNKGKMKNASAPNFIHSVDAAHLVATISLLDENISLSMIHDSYGTHACDVPKMLQALKDAAIEVHSQPLLANFKSEISNLIPTRLLKDLPELPEEGTLDLEVLKKSTYFFS